MGSDAFLLPLEPRGLYREMLSQAWRRGAKLPNDHEQIRRATGATEAEWVRCWPVIERFWRVDGDSIVNDTQIEVYAESIELSQKRSVAGQRGNEKRWGKPDKPAAGGKYWRFTNLYVSAKMHRVVLEALGKRASGVDFDRFYNDMALRYAEHGQPADVLTDLKQCALRSYPARADSTPDVEASAARRAREDQTAWIPQTLEEKAAAKAALRGCLSVRP